MLPYYLQQYKKSIIPDGKPYKKHRHENYKIMQMKLEALKKNFRADRSCSNEQFYPQKISSKCFGFRDMNQKLHFTLCAFFSHVGHLGSKAGSSGTFLKLHTLIMIVAKFG